MYKSVKSQRKKILFLVGSLNQTMQMHQIASHLTDYDCFFSQLYSSSPLVQFALKRGLLEGTILGQRSKQIADAY
jgi:hypothetical protein